MATRKKAAAKAANVGFAAKTWADGEAITAEELNRVEHGVEHALTLAQTNEHDIAAMESGATHSMVADTQKPSVPSNLALSIGLLPVWKAGSDVLLRSAIVDVSATDDTTVKAGTVIANGLALKPRKSYAVWFMSSAGTLTHNMLQVNTTGKSVTLSADESFAQGTTLMLVTENDI